MARPHIHVEPMKEFPSSTGDMVAQSLDNLYQQVNSINQVKTQV